jgi:hypothetical protein
LAFLDPALLPPLPCIIKLGVPLISGRVSKLPVLYDPKILEPIYFSCSDEFFCCLIFRNRIGYMELIKFFLPKTFQVVVAISDLPHSTPISVPDKNLFITMLPIILNAFFI